MTKLSDNIKKLLGIRKLTISDLSRKTGIHHSVINRIINGETENPSIRTVSPIAAYFSLSVNDLLSDQPLSKENNTDIAYTAENEKIKQIPIISWSDATRWKGLEIDNIKKYKLIYTEKGITKAGFALKIQEDISFLFKEGSILIIEPTIKPKNRDFIIVQDGKYPMATLRRYITEGSSVFLKPMDQSLHAVEFDKDKHHIIGVVVQSLFDYY